MEHSPSRGTSRCAPGAFSLTAPVFRSSRAQKGVWCARDSTLAAGPGAHGESTILRQARSQPHPSTRSHAPIKPAAPATSHTNPHQPHHRRRKTARQSSQQPRQHHTSTRSNRITNAKTAHQPRQQSWQNRISSNKSRAPTESPPSATPRVNHLTSAACINASCTATGRRRTFP